jgi:hypothetical protein
LRGAAKAASGHAISAVKVKPLRQYIPTSFLT